MATKKYVKDVQAEKGKFGHYKTGTGGGEPIPAGKKMTSEKRDPDQPRDSQGHFTYNAVNGKPLKEISKSHGHSRGTTIPPTLTGGRGDIHYYSDSSHEHIVKGGQDALEKYTSLTVGDAYRKGDKLIGFDGKVAIAPKDFIESASEFVANAGKDKELSGALKELVEAKASGDKEKIESSISSILSAGHFEGDPTGSWARKEAETPEEKAALAKAEVEKTKGHELVERKREEEFAAAPKIKRFTSWAKTFTSSPSVPTEKREEITASIGGPTDPTASLSDEQIKKFSEKAGFDVPRSMLAEAFASGDSGVGSAEDVLKIIGESSSEVEPEVKEEIKEESAEEVKEDVKEEEFSVDAVMSVLGGEGEEVEELKKDLLTEAKEWAKSQDIPGMASAKDELELIKDYLTASMKKEEK